MANKRQQLLDFIDQRAFDVILKASPDRLEEKEQEQLRELQRKTENEKKKFHHDYKTAEEVKENFLDNVHSKAARKTNQELKHFHLPTLPELKDDFLALCNELQV